MKRALRILVVCAALAAGLLIALAALESLAREFAGWQHHRYNH